MKLGSYKGTYVHNDYEYSYTYMSAYIHVCSCCHLQYNSICMDCVHY